MLHTGNGEVRGQNGEGIDQQVVLIVDTLLELLLGAILFAEETRALSDGFLVDAGSCGYHTGGIPLHLNRRGTHHQLARLHITQVVIALAGIVPTLQLTIEESLQGRVVHKFLFASQHLLARQNLECAQLIFIEVVGIDLVDTEGSIAIASPTTTEIELGEDAPDAVMTREYESQGVILTIRGVGKSYLAQQGREEGSGRSETIDAQGVVRSVFVGPFCVVNESWG